MSSHDRNVFVNCPFDDDYKPILEAIIFAVHDCGFVARSALEQSDASQVRIDKICELIRASRFGIHDISRTELDPNTQLPRFNMPLELGIFLGAKRFGSNRQREKTCLIFDRERYRYQQFCSDIAGQDVAAHQNDPSEAIRRVRDWLRNATRGSGTIMPGGTTVVNRYAEFVSDLPGLCQELRLDLNELIFNDLTTLIAEWIKENDW